MIWTGKYFQTEKAFYGAQYAVCNFCGYNRRITTRVRGATPQMITDDQLDEAVFLYTVRGVSLDKLSKKFFISRGTIKGYLQARGVPIRSRGTVPGKPRQDRNAAKREALTKLIKYFYWELQLSGNEIAERLGLPDSSSVYTYMARAGIPRRSVSHANKIAYKRGRKLVQMPERIAS